MDNNKIKVLIIDDQELYRAGVKLALSQQPEFELLECDLTSDPMEILESQMPDVALISSRLTEQNWLDLGKRISRSYPNIRVIMLSPDPNDGVLFEVIKTGAFACLNKNILGKELVTTIKLAYKGKYPINDVIISRPAVAKHVLNQFQDKAFEAISEAISPLTKREKQILTHVANGNTNKQIASLLDISDQTIKNHVSSIMRKLNANDRAHAVYLALQRGMIFFEKSNN